MKKILLTAAAVFAAAFGVSAQVTTDPSPVQVDSKNLVIYFHANEGNKGLMGLPQSDPVYAHTGVLTTSSTGPSDWKYAPDWGDNSLKYQLTYVSPNLYSLTIGDIRTYYGVPESETITKLAFVFRNANGTKEGKTADNGDIFVDVLEAGLQVSLGTNLGGSTVMTEDTSNVHFTLSATEPSTLSININGREDIGKAENSTLLEADYHFIEPGTYTIWGNATNAAGETKSTSIKLTLTAASPQKDYPGGVPKMGAVPNDDGSVTFCFCAPGKTNVTIVGNWNDYVVSDEYTMYYQDYNGFRYFWITLPDIDPTKQYIYYYMVDAMYNVGDPYARLVLDPYNDNYISSAVFPNRPPYPTGKIPGNNVPLAVYQGNINDFDWTDDDFKPADKDNLIVYELLVRDFTGTEGKANGNGTIKKALEKLDYLKKLGVNVIELLPINEFNGNNSWGYNPNFYMAPDKAYGTPDDYKEFINACHENGIAVVLDMVFNQAEWLQPWFRMYQSGQNPFFNASAPHAYSVFNDWNQGYPIVRQHFKDVLQYWMEEYHVDGFRFDLVKGLGNNDSYPNNGDSGTNAYNKSRVENMRDLQLAMLAVNPDCIFINENLAGAQEENEMAAYGQLNWANINYAGQQYAKGTMGSSGLNRMLATKDSRKWGSTVSYLESHDEQRLAYMQDTQGVDGVKGNLAVSMRRLGSAAAQMIMAPGSHMIWMFSELGNAQNTKNATGGNNSDPKVVHWNYLDEPDRYGLYKSYSELINVRLQNPELFTEDCGFSLSFDGWTLGRYYHSSAGDKELHLLINPQVNKEMTFNVSFASTDASAYTIKSKSYGTEPTFSVTEGTVTVPSNSYVLITNGNVTDGVDSVVADGSALEPVSTVWYSLTGQRLSSPAKGINVKVVKYSDGSTRSYKEICK